MTDIQKQQAAVQSRNQVCLNLELKASGLDWSVTVAFSQPSASLSGCSANCLLVRLPVVLSVYLSVCMLVRLPYLGLALRLFICLTA